MAGKEWWEKGEHSDDFNDSVNRKTEPKQNTDDVEKPPVLGLQGGPKPPGDIREAADAAAREQAARDRYFANLEQEAHNEVEAENDISDGNDIGDSGIGDSGDDGR